MRTLIKQTQRQAYDNLKFTGELAKELHGGATIVEARFNGLDWFVLVKGAMSQVIAKGNLVFTQYETLMRHTDSPEYFLIKTYHNMTTKQAKKAFKESYFEEVRSIELAIEAGNLKLI